MRIWRISEYADLSGRGGLIAEGRWHPRGTPVVYCADHPSTAMLERLVHVDPEDLPAAYRLLAVDVDDMLPTARVAPGDLPDDWRFDKAMTRSLGAAFLKGKVNVLLHVPSVLVPHAWNILLNPNHPEAGRCRIVDVVQGLFDPRLFQSSVNRSI